MVTGATVCPLAGFADPKFSLSQRSFTHPPKAFTAIASCQQSHGVGHVFLGFAPLQRHWPQSTSLNWYQLGLSATTFQSASPAPKNEMRGRLCSLWFGSLPSLSLSWRSFHYQLVIIQGLFFACDLLGNEVVGMVSAMMDVDYYQDCW